MNTSNIAIITILLFIGICTGITIIAAAVSFKILLAILALMGASSGLGIIIGAANEN